MIDELLADAEFRRYVYSIIVISMALVSVTRGFRLKRNLFYYSNIQQAVTS